MTDGDARPHWTESLAKPRLGRDLALAAALILLYFAAGKFGLSLAFIESSASAVWPPTGLAIAALVVLGLRFWPAVYAGALWANLDNHTPLAPSAVIALGNLLEALLGAYLVRAWARGRDAFDRPADVFRFIAVAGLLAPLVSASVGIGTLVWFGLAPAALAQPIWLTWWLGDAAGAVVLAPALILLARPRPPDDPRRTVETWAAFATVALVAYAVWGHVSTLLFGERPYAFLTIPVVVWASLRLGSRATALAALLLDAVAVWGSLEGRGPFVLADPNSSLLYLQAFLGVVALLTLPTAALAHQQAVAQAGLRRAAEGLERQVQERTGELQQQAVRLAQSQERLGSIFANSQVGITLARPDGGVLDVNPAAEAVWRRSRDDFLAKGFDAATLFVDPADQARLGEALRRDGRVNGFEAAMRRGDGQVRTMNLGVSLVQHDGAPAVLSSVVDVTAQKEAEARFRLLFDANPMGILITRMDSSVLDANPGAEALWGLTRAQFLDPAFRMSSLYEDPSQRAPIVEAIRREGRARGVELRMKRGDGSVRTMLFNTEVIDWAGEKVFLAAGQDITARREAEERFRQLFFGNPVAVVIARQDGKGILDVNPAYEKLIGYSRAQLLDPAFDLRRLSVDRDDRERRLTRLRAQQGAEALEVQVRRADGEARTVVASVRPLERDGVPCFLSALQDVTEERAAEAALRRAQERFQRVFESSPVAISLTKQDGTFLDVNEAFARLVGRPRGELLGGTLRAPSVYETQQDRDRMLVALRASGVVRELELRFRRPDGDVRTALASLEFVDVGGGTTILGLFQDITERLRAQGEREARIATEAELERLRRSEAFRTEFINSTAHELSTPLTPIVLGVRVLATDAKLSEAQRHTVQSIERNVGRLKHIVEDLLHAADVQARTIALQKRRLNLTRELKASVAAHHDAAVRAGVALVEPEETGLTVSADPQRLQLVLGHLLGNALKFTPPGGKVWIGARRVEDWVRVSINDTGVGLTAKQMEGLWKPFGQAHDKSQKTDSGSGLGLYVTKGVIDLHGGEVGCSSEGPGKGASFWFTLPLATGHIDPLSGKGGRDGDEPPAEPKRNLNPGVHDAE